MTDREKLDKLIVEIKGLRKEVKDNITELGNSESERIGLFKDLEIYDNILSLIDSMQEDPTHKCKGCNNVKGCITCVDGSEYAHIEECNITGIRSKEATGKLKECIDNITEEGLEEARKQLQELVNGGLDEEINRYIEQHSSELPGYFDLRRIARHFFVFGLNKSMQKESQLDSIDFKTALEKKVREAQDWTYIEEEGGSCPLNEEFGAADLEEFAEWGASWMRDQMMKDAVDFTFTRCCSAQLDMDLHTKGLDYGDEVKLVIIKKE